MASRKHGETVDEYEARLLRALGELHAAKASGDPEATAEAVAEVEEVVEEAPAGADTTTAEEVVETETTNSETTTDEGTTTTEREPETGRTPRSEHLMDRRIFGRKG